MINEETTSENEVANKDSQTKSVEQTSKDPVIEKRKENENINQVVNAYGKDVDELYIHIIEIFKILETILFNFSIGMITRKTISLFLQLSGKVFQLKKLYSTKPLTIKGKEKLPLILIYKRLFTFNRNVLIPTLAGSDKIKRIRYQNILKQ